MTSARQTVDRLPACEKQNRRAAVIVAHPDDELLWAGGTILTTRAWEWEVYSLCRASDPDRAPRFRRVLGELRAGGAIGDLDDGPNQTPLELCLVERAIVALLPRCEFEVILTHGPQGEYTRHRRHEETCRAVTSLWSVGLLRAAQVWMFAYSDSGGRELPVAQDHADRYGELPDDVWKEKYRLITEVYGFAPDSWEARATPRAEAFWCFGAPEAASRWIDSQEVPT